MGGQGQWFYWILKVQIIIVIMKQEWFKVEFQTQLYKRWWFRSTSNISTKIEYFSFDTKSPIEYFAQVWFFGQPLQSINLGFMQSHTHPSIKFTISFYFSANYQVTQIRIPLVFYCSHETPISLFISQFFFTIHGCVCE